MRGFRSDAVWVGRVERIAEGSELLAIARADGGLGGLQAFHALMLLIRTGRRLNEVLMMDFDPLESLHPMAPDSTTSDNDATDGAFVARLRYKQTKIESDTPASIPVEAEIVSINRAPQENAHSLLAQFGEPERTPRYLFLSVVGNRLGNKPFPMPTMHLRLDELTKALAITDSRSSSNKRRSRLTAAPQRSTVQTCTT